jgi:hypothetical protein
MIYPFGLEYPADLHPGQAKEGAPVLQQAFFRDAVPWIVLTLIDTTGLFRAEKPPERITTG